MTHFALRAVRGSRLATLPTRLAYWALCRGIHLPMLFRAGSSLLRAFPVLSSWIGAVARRSPVTQALSRQASFSSTSHASKLIAGDFLIGMEAGPRYEADKASFDLALARLQDTAAISDRAARARVEWLMAQPEAAFDAVEDYVMWVVWQAIRRPFGTIASLLTDGAAGRRPDRQSERQFMLMLRHVAAQLTVGDVAPDAVYRRAEAAAASLSERVGEIEKELASAWNARGAPAREAAGRNAIGLAWVSHPVTVQGAALVIRELLERRPVHAMLSRAAALAGDEIWNRHGDFRTLVRSHVLELMRFRPVFPLLARNVPRNTWFDAGGRTQCPASAGSTLRILTIGALFDRRATEEPSQYRPGREWFHDPADRYLMFGHGERRCPAKDPAVEIVTSAVIGLLALPGLRWATSRCKSNEYDGPMVASMRLRFRRDA